MKTRLNKILSIILIAVILLSSLLFTVSAQEITGACGENVTWSFDESTGELVISGTGDMYDYDASEANMPWIDYCLSIKNVTISDGVTSIGDGAFLCCESLSNVKIPYGITSIGIEAFLGCVSLENISIPESVKIIDDCAFSFCGLTSVTIPQGATTIGVGAFSGCIYLEYVEIPDGVTTIDDEAFSDCESLKNITIPKSVTNLGVGVLHDCECLTEIIVDSQNPAYLNDEYGVLLNKDKTILIQYPKGNARTSYMIPDSVITISNFAFKSCNNLTNVTIPDSVITIGDSAFSSCHNLTSIAIPDSVTSITHGAFQGCSSLKNITIPDSITSIGDSVFSWCESLTSITIPDSVTSIDYGAFQGCISLKSITIPDSVTSIGGYAFKFCSGLTDVYYLGTQRQWGQIKIGEGNDSLVNATIFIEAIDNGVCGDYLTYTLYTDGVLVIDGMGAMYDDLWRTWFDYRSSIKTVTIGNSVTSIGSSAFFDCSSLTSITIPDSVTAIGSEAFSYCTSLTSATMGADITTIGDYAFSNCTSLTSITIPDNVKNIGNFAFSYCARLSGVTIPASVTTIGDSAFANCSNLEEVIVNSDAVLSMGDNLFSNSPKTMICCEENSWIHYYADSNDMKFCILDSDGNPAFEIKSDTLVSYRGSSDDIRLPSVTKIGYGAFENNSAIKKVEISKGVSRIYNDAFKNCSALESVIIPQSATSIGATAFDGCDDVTIWCYAGSYADEYAQSHGIDVEYITLQMDKDVVYLNPNGTMTMTYSFNTPIAENVSVMWESTDKSIVTVDLFGNIKGVRAGTAVVVATSRDGSMRDYCVVKVVGIEALSTVTIDYDNGFITGIDSNTTSLDGLIVMTDSTCSLSYTTLGTDSVVYVQRENEIVDAYTVLIFGDVNGDGWYDGTDSIIVSCLANGLLTQDSVSEAVYRAADCNHDGVIDSFDVAILEQAGLLLSNVDQSKSNEELATDEAFIEYLDLIDQTPDEDVVEEEETPQPEEEVETPETEELNLIEFIINIIKKLFELLISYLPIK